MAVFERLSETDAEAVAVSEGVLERVADCEAAEVTLPDGDFEAGILLDGDAAGEFAGVLVAVEVVKEPLLGMHWE